MIETVFSNDNGEDNRTNRMQSSFKMPKNIRQVGKSSANKKIYVEDYVMTYIKQLAGEDYSKCRVAVLVGQYIKIENCRNIFVSGAIEIEDIDTSGEIVFTNDIWTNIYEKIKKYFVDTEIVGWYIGGPGYLFEDKDKILKAHIDNFAGQDKTLLTFDNMEKEEIFLVYENNHLCRQEGYYIYYEKNEEMQSYMVEYKKTQSDELTYDDRVSKEIRTVIQNKKPETDESKSVSRLMYAAGTLLAVIILVVGAAMLSNYEQMKNMQDTLNYLTKNINGSEALSNDTDTPSASKDNANKKASTSTSKNNATKNTNTNKDSLNVEVVPGKVKPLENKASESVDNKKSEVTKAAGNQDNKKDSNSVGTLPKDSSASKTTNKKVVSDTIVTNKNKEAIKQETKYYTVRAGDTLVGISFKLYNSADYMKKIMELNNIQDEDVIIEGQKLIVP